MKKASRFTVSPHWELLLKDMNLNPPDVLEIAQLPRDLFQQKNAQLLPSEYFKLWTSIELAAANNKQPLPLLFADSLCTESFDAPIFVSLCSPNFNLAIKRLRHYKPLIGPARLHIQQTQTFTGLSVTFENCPKHVPDVLHLAELVFFTQLMRIATREKISPIFISLPYTPKEHLTQYQQYFGCNLTNDRHFELRFSAKDAQTPFLTHNTGMWDFFEDSLNQKMAMMNRDDSIRSRIRTVLLKALPSGETRLDQIAESLTMSKRTLQRKLAAEGILFQELLNETRLELADHYLKKSQLPLNEIAFLLGYNQPNSFTRAYNSWKGMSPVKFREKTYYF